MSLTSLYKTIVQCRVCKSERLTRFWSGGEMYIVGFPKSLAEKETCSKAPLAICVCEECWLVQLMHSVNPDLMYREFFYRSGINEMMRDALYDVTQKAKLQVNLKGGDRVLDIGCNDGTMLLTYPIGVECVGIDPAKNIQKSGTQPGGWFFINDYFSEEVVRKYYHPNFKIVTAIAMFYDLEDPVQFCQEVAAVMHKDGVFVVQMNYLKSMLECNGVDNISHEHLTYFSLTSLMKVFEEAGMTVFHAELNGVNGGSLRVYASHAGRRQADSTVTDILRRESEEQLNTLTPYSKFCFRVRRNCDLIDNWIEKIVDENKLLYAYGASTRGTTLLQLLQSADKIIAVAERDPNKIGRYMVGGNWPKIISEEEARKFADYFLCLPWHFWDAIKVREEAWMKKGGKFILPMPWAKIALRKKDGTIVHQYEMFGKGDPASESAA
jgi:NDP-4-keto-2,6-dideoxyhexose 3-C-methyltransferase